MEGKDTAEKPRELKEIKIMNLVPFKNTKRWDDYDFWAPYFPSIRDLFDHDSYTLDRTAGFIPALDVSEDENAYKVSVELPGIDPKNIDICVESNTLTVRGERKEQPKKNYHRIERQYGGFVRSLRLPAQVNADKINAGYKDGILGITLPKAETAKPKKITVKS